MEANLVGSSDFANLDETSPPSPSHLTNPEAAERDIAKQTTPCKEEGTIKKN